MQQIIQYSLFDTNIVSSNYGDYATRSLSDRDYFIKSNIKFIDLFAGIGGFRIALKKVGAKCVFSSEWDKYARQTYQANFNEIPFGDITKVDLLAIPDFNILCAGFPCQPFSSIGKREGF